MNIYKSVSSSIQHENRYLVREREREREREGIYCVRCLTSAKNKWCVCVVGSTHCLHSDIMYHVPESVVALTQVLLVVAIKSKVCCAREQ